MAGGLARLGIVDGSVVAVGVDGLADIAAREILCGLAHPLGPLAAHAGERGIAGTLDQGSERGSGFDGLQLLVVADNDELGPGEIDLLDDAGHLF